MMSVGVSLGLVFVHVFRFSILCVFWFSLDLFVRLFAFVALALVSSVLCQEIGWEEHVRSDLFCVEWYVKPLLNQSIKLIPSMPLIQSVVAAARCRNGCTTAIMWQVLVMLQLNLKTS